jgi:predicted DNA-binding protein with PD1-like motif
MEPYRSNDGMAAMGRIALGSDLLEELTQLAASLNMVAGTVQVIGAVSSLVLGYYHQDRREYETLDLPGHWEIASGLGNVSIRDGLPFVHLHIVASGADGRAVGGHLMPGTIVFAAEAYVRALDGKPPVRAPDEQTGLALWE